MKTYGEAVTSAQANIIMGAVIEAMALGGEDELALEAVALVFTAETPSRNLVGVLSFDDRRESLSELTTVGLFQHGISALVQLTGPASAGEEEDEA